MKLKLILLLINLGLATSIFSQSLLYLYDAAGNRITRMQVATRSFVLQKNEVNVVSSEGLLERKAIKLFPNPVQTKLTVLLSELFEPGYGEVFLYDLQGRLLLSQDVTSIRTILQLDSFVSGTSLMAYSFSRDIYFYSDIPIYGTTIF